jgi:putative heme-binding domain-containing protein
MSLYRKVKALVAMISRLRADQARASEQNARLSRELEARTGAYVAAGEAGEGELAEVEEQVAGDRERGRTVFARRCSGCHQLEGAGFAVGPDLAPLADKSARVLLTAILDPNRAVEDKFVNYSAITTDGQQFSGILTSETATSITLAGQEGKQQVILRGEIDELHSSKKSLMPEGLERDLSKQDLADVIAYVGGTGPKPKEFAGNRPHVIQPEVSGTLELRASNCSIFGGTLVFEPAHGNLGYWQSSDDRAAWACDVVQPGTYEVVLEYACDNGTSGNRFRLQAGSQQIMGKTTGTGSWDNYQELPIGNIELSAGPQQIDFQGVGRIKNSLIDLRRIELRPKLAR